MRLRQFIQSAHRWLGLALAAQIAIWTASGVVMSILPIEHVRGETTAAISAPVELEVQHYFPPAGVLADVPHAQQLTLKSWLGREVYIVSGPDRQAMFDADTGERLSPISERDARRVALADFAGEGELARIVMMTRPPQEVRGSGALWRAEFTDRDETRLYISPETGDVVARRNRVWRFYDFFWMLHIMDYDEREDFNNPLIRAFAITALAFALTGVGLVVIRLGNRRYLEDLSRALQKIRGAADGE